MGKKLILYAEDDPDDRFIFENCFAQYRDEVNMQMFSDGLEILNHLKTSPNLQPNLIVLDINMPQLDGKDALRVLRGMPAYSSIPVVLLTTSSSPVDRYFAQHYNAGFITKPMDEIEMDKIAKDLLKFCE
jgi:CheY-like chemotaxis protein